MRPFLLLISTLWAMPVIATDPIAIPSDHAQRIERGTKLFQSDVAGLLKQHCLKCHGGEKTHGDLDLATREGLLKGGTNGPSVVPFQPGKSYLLDLVKHDDEPAMPDNQPKLADAAIAKIEQWIELGAPFDQPLIAGKQPPRDASVVTDEDRRWWSFRPLAAVAPPAINKPQTVINDVDRFVIAKAGEQGLSLSPAAEKRTLIRRLYLDLLGIPPTPDEIDAFLQDNSPTAWSTLVDRTLARPEYGERWARHWLDVARFAESHGFEQDYDRPGAWAYRDFVIRALNSDLPYDTFVRWQIAGDEYLPDDPLALSATGFLGAGVFPTQITANEVERTRYDALDDMLSTTGSAFLGLSIGCARCHDHKYDPIPVKDYYRLLSTFTTTVRSNIEVELDPESTRPLREQWQAELQPLQAELAAYEATLQPEFQKWLISESAKHAHVGWTLIKPKQLKAQGNGKFKPLEDGSYLVTGANPTHDKYTLTFESSARQITGFRLEALTDRSLPKMGPGRAPNGNFGLSKITIAITPIGSKTATTLPIDQAITDFEQNKTNLSIAASLDDQATTGWAVDPQFGRNHEAVFILKEPLANTSGGIFTLTLDFQVNSQHGLGRFRLSLMTDHQPALQLPLLPTGIDELLQKATTIDSKISAAESQQLFDWWKATNDGYQSRLKKVQAHQAKEPVSKTPIMICGEGYKPIRHHTQGADFFDKTYHLNRGSVDQKKEVAEQGYLQVLLPKSVNGNPWYVPPPEGAKFSNRRRALAEWILDRELGAGNLTARVIVNRVWQHHFGTGIVTTSNDFGRTGTPPTHPELLDYLAQQLIDNQYRLKPLHRLLLLSATYQQTSHPTVAQVKADPNNRYFARFQPRRLEAEAIRDSILSVTEQLDRTMYGPGTKSENSVRRSIYFMIKRSQLIGSMVVFDQPEPLVSQGSRPTTTVAPQALLLMNSPQIRAWSTALAKRVENQLPTGGQADWRPVITTLYSLTLGRPVRDAELQTATRYLEQQTTVNAAAGDKARSAALVDFCQVLLCLNEFAYID